MNLTHCDIFTTRLWFIDLSQLNNHFEEWRSEIQLLRQSDMQPRGRSNRLGWNSQPILMALPSFKPLHQECVKAFNQAIKIVSPIKDYRYYIEAWANMNDQGSFNTLHCHSGALMSGVFYLTVPEGSGELIFRDPRPGVLHSVFQEQGAPNTSGEIKVVPKEGMMIIFPSWLEHRVEPHLNSISRVSIAINIQQAMAKLY